MAAPPDGPGGVGPIALPRAAEPVGGEVLIPALRPGLGEPVAATAPTYVDRVSSFLGNRSDVVDFYKQLDDAGVDYRTLINDAVNKYGLTQDEAHAVFGYTTKLFYRDLNNSLKAGGSPQAQELASLVRSGMEKMPSSGPVQYRGWRLTPDQLKDFDKQFAPGNVVESNFWSSSPEKDSSYIAERNVVINTRAARDISDLAFGVHFHDLVGKPTYKSETLIPPGVQFDVLKVNPDGTIVLEQR